MSLLDELRAIENFPPSHVPSIAEVLELVGKSIAYAEFGDDFLKAADADREARAAGEPAHHLDDLFSPPEQEPEPSPSAPPAASTPAAPASPAGAPDGPPASTAELQQRVLELEQQLANQRAAAQRTTPGAPSTPPASSSTPPASESTTEGGW